MSVARLPRSQRPRTVQCRATSKRTGKQCGQFVPEGHITCAWHGGNAPKSKLPPRRGVSQPRRHGRRDQWRVRDPAEALLNALREADAMAQHLRERLVGEEVLDPATVEALGTWPDRAARIAKTCLDAKVEGQRARTSERNGNYWAHFRRRGRCRDGR
jgi:hypothetical protein